MSIQIQERHALKEAVLPALRGPESDVVAEDASLSICATSRGAGAARARSALQSALVITSVKYSREVHFLRTLQRVYLGLARPPSCAACTPVRHQQNTNLNCYKMHALVETIQSVPQPTKMRRFACKDHSLVIIRLASWCVCCSEKNVWTSENYRKLCERTPLEPDPCQRTKLISVTRPN